LLQSVQARAVSLLSGRIDSRAIDRDPPRIFNLWLGPRVLPLISAFAYCPLNMIVLKKPRQKHAPTLTMQCRDTIYAAGILVGILLCCSRSWDLTA